MNQLLPFLLFAFVASITPGPTNLLVLSNSARHGLVAALPIIVGGCTGAAAMVLAVGLGVGESMVRYPAVQQGLGWLGALWLSGLAWQIFVSPPVALDEARAGVGPRLGFFGAAALQLVNPKTWMMAVAVMSVFADESGDHASQVLRLSLVFFLVALPCLGVWAGLGLGVARLLRTPASLRRLNRLLALLLLASAWFGLLG